MTVKSLMTSTVKACRADDDLQRAAQIMWDNDCGIVPVVDAEDHVVGMVTDRDICMAAYTRGQPLWAMSVSSAMAAQVHAVREADSVHTAEAVMQGARVRRLPVVDDDGRLTGIVSLSDLARHASRAPGGRSDGLSSSSLLQTLAKICERNVRSAEAAATVKPADSPPAPRAAGNGKARDKARPTGAAAAHASPSMSNRR